MYEIPSEFNYPLHHPRPRFKNDVENVLGYGAISIAQIGRKPRDQFKNELRAEIRRYGANASSTLKTIDNWRTEIGALFGMYIENDAYTTPTQLSVDLANTSDLPAFFRGFVYAFQYPAGHLKPRFVGELLEEGIAFHPCRWLFNFFLQTDVSSIDKYELCHCVLNDMRVTRDHESFTETAARIKANRLRGVEYDRRSDVVRSAGDILDYCVLADLLVEDHDGRFRINERNRDIVEMIASSDNYFNAYDEVPHFDVSKIGALESDWFQYVDHSYQELKKKIQAVLKARIRRQIAQGTNMSEDVVGLHDLAIGSDGESGQSQSQRQNTTGEDDGLTPTDLSAVADIDDNDAARIGDFGENLIWQHECIRVTNEGRKDLVHLIKRIPTHLAVGYDIKSIEADTEFDRFIEVKSTKSRRPLMFKQIHLTPNEWRTAQSSGSRYCVYRLQISDEGCRLFILRDPVQKFRDQLITIIPRDGMDISFTDEAGEEVELLCVR